MFDMCTCMLQATYLNKITESNICNTGHSWSLEPFCLIGSSKPTAGSTSQMITVDRCTFHININFDSTKDANSKHHLIIFLFFGVESVEMIHINFSENEMILKRKEDPQKGTVKSFFANFREVKVGENVKRSAWFFGRIIIYLLVLATMGTHNLHF